jgi:tetratricopeptide (TPR) repeat protein
MNSVATEYFELGKKKFFRFDREEAREDFRKALSIEPDNPKILGWLTISLVLLGEYDEAMKLLEKVKGSDTAEVYIARGTIYDSRDGNKKDAIDQYSKAIYIDQNNDFGFAMRGLTYSQIKKESEALSDMKNALRVNPSAYNYLILGHVKEEFEDFQGALSSFKKAAEIDPMNSRAWAYMASIKAKIENYDQALSDFNRAIELDPNYVWALNNRGNLKLDNLNDKQGALADFTKVIELDPEYKWAWVNRARGQESLGNFSDALADYNKAIELDPSYVWAIYKRGELKFIYLDDNQGALVDYSKAIEVDPDYKFAWANRGALKEEMGDIQGALDDINRAIAIDENYSWAVNRRSFLYKSLGNYELCLADRRKYYEVNGIPKFNFEDPEVQNVTDSVFTHLSEITLPQLKDGGECLIEYFECILYWGEERIQSLNQGKQTFTHTGKYGFGYIVLSDKYLRIISLGNLSKKYGKQLGHGLGKRLIFALLSNFDVRSVEKSDKLWTVPFKDINNVSKDDELINLVTTSETWQISSYFLDNEYMQAALELARMGNLRKLVDIEKLRIKNTHSSSDDEIFEKIERLASLREKGIITSEEFEKKKKELLARI